MGVEALIRRAEAAGLTLFLDNGRLRWRASTPPPEDLLTALRAARDEVKAALAERMTPAAQGAPPPEGEASAPASGTPRAAPERPWLAYRPGRAWERGSLEARATAYLTTPGAEIVPGPGGWLFITLMDGRYLYLAPALVRRLGVPIPEARSGATSVCVGGSVGGKCDPSPGKPQNT